MSTPFGKRGFFHEAWARGGPEWERIQVRRRIAADCARLFWRKNRGEGRGCDRGVGGGARGRGPGVGEYHFFVAGVWLIMVVGMTRDESDCEITRPAGGLLPAGAIYLFGSVARENRWRDSDLGFLVVVPDDRFRGENASRRRAKSGAGKRAFAKDIVTWRSTDFQDAAAWVKCSLPPPWCEEGARLNRMTPRRGDREWLDRHSMDSSVRARAGRLRFILRRAVLLASRPPRRT